MVDKSYLFQIDLFQIIMNVKASGTTVQWTPPAWTMMVLTPVNAPLDIVLMERTVQVSSFKYFKYLLDENDKNSELRTDAVSEILTLYANQVYYNE